MKQLVPVNANRMREGNKEKKKDRPEVYWCKNYNKGTCAEQAPHMNIIKPDEPPLPVLHICAHCYQKEGKRMEHKESECTAKKVDTDLAQACIVNRDQQGVSGFKHQVSRKHNQSSHEQVCREFGPREVNTNMYSGLEFLANPRANSIEQQVRMVNYIRRYGKPNIYGARVVLNTHWNLRLMWQLAETVSDRETVQFITYGWPLNHNGSMTTQTIGNHSSAVNFREQVDKYVSKELSYQCLLGPFITPPWDVNVAISPMSSRPKKGDNFKRHIIMDFSWPHDGTSVNDGIPSDIYLHQIMNLVYPTIDMLCKRVAALGPGCLGYKKDMNRAFKQIYIDPSDWPLQGISWRNVIYFDKTAVMGSRSAPYICQRTTSFIRHVMQNLAYFLYNYVDDFMGIESRQKAMQAYNTLGNLLRDLGVGEAEEKICAAYSYH